MLLYSATQINNKYAHTREKNHFYYSNLNLRKNRINIFTHRRHMGGGGFGYATQTLCRARNSRPKVVESPCRHHYNHHPSMYRTTPFTTSLLAPQRLNHRSEVHVPRRGINQQQPRWHSIPHNREATKKSNKNVCVFFFSSFVYLFTSIEYYLLALFACCNICTWACMSVLGIEVDWVVC